LSQRPLRESEQTIVAWNCFLYYKTISFLYKTKPLVKASLHSLESNHTLAGAPCAANKSLLLNISDSSLLHDLSMATVLAIETSCDETAVAVVKNRQVCSVSNFTSPPAVWRCGAGGGVAPTRGND